MEEGRQSKDEDRFLSYERHSTMCDSYLTWSTMAVNKIEEEGEEFFNAFKA